MQSTHGPVRKWRALSEARYTHRLGAIKATTPHNNQQNDSNNENATSKLSNASDFDEFEVVLPKVKHSNRGNGVNAVFLTSDSVSPNPASNTISDVSTQDVILTHINFFRRPGLI